MTQQTTQPAQAAQSPYAWTVSGISKMFYGPHAEYDARLEANHCGGTAEAFPLFKEAQAAQGEPVLRYFKDEDCIKFGCTKALPRTGNSWGTLYAAPQPQPAVAQGAGEVVGEARSLPGSEGFTMACFHADKVPVGTKLYAQPDTQAIALDAAIDAALIFKDIDAIECLQDVISHYNDFTKACDTMMKLCIDNSEDDSVLYWKHQLDVLIRMKTQAESVLNEME